MTLPAIVVTDGVRIQISDQHENDFIHNRVSIWATNPDGVTVHWTLPVRLMLRFDVGQIVAEEIVAELEEKALHLERLGLL